MYVDRSLANDVFNKLQLSDDNAQNNEEKEAAIRLLRWSLGPLCNISPPEMTFARNQKLQSLEVFFTGGLISSSSETPCFRLIL
jgi:hypothetical protein